MNRQFPPEIIQLIVEAALDPYDIFSADNMVSRCRYTTLKSFALLNSTWRAASDPELFRWVTIKSKEAAANLVELVQQRGRMVEGAQDLSISGFYDAEDLSTVSELLRSTPNVTNVYLFGSTINIGDLARLQQLRRLLLVTITVEASLPPSTLFIPNLRQLEMLDTIVPPSAIDFLSPSFLPELRYLDVESDSSIPTSLAGLIPQLGAVRYDDADLPLTITLAKSLLLLSLPGYDLLSQLPSLPPFIHIDFYGYYDPVQYSADALDEILGSAETGPRVIFIYNFNSNVALDSAIKRCEVRGIRVERGEDMIFERAIERMEEILKEEKQAAEKAERERK